MKILIEEIDDLYYAEVTLSLKDIEEISSGKLVVSSVGFKFRKCHVTTRLETSWDKKNDFSSREDDYPFEKRKRGRPKKTPGEEICL